MLGSSGEYLEAKVVVRTWVVLVPSNVKHISNPRLQVLKCRGSSVCLLGLAICRLEIIQQYYKAIRSKIVLHGFNGYNSAINKIVHADA